LEAQTTATAEPHGIMQLTAPANTDTLVSPSFGRPPVWRGLLTAVSANVLTVAGTPNWTANQWAPNSEIYYVRLMTGTLAGHYYVVTANTGNTETVDTAGMDLSVITAGNQAELAPFWTLGTFYPAGQTNVSFVPSASPLVRQTELLFYDPAGTGVNRSSAETYYYYNGAWRKVGAPVATSYNAKVLLPDTYFLQRNKAAATTLTVGGRVFTSKLATVVEARSATQQDNYMAVAYPVPVSLRNTGLVSGGAFSTSLSPLSRADQLFVFDPAQTGINRSPSATYYYYNGGWRKIGAAVSVDFSDTLLLAPGSGFILRKAASPSSPMWSFDTHL